MREEMQVGENMRVSMSDQDEKGHFNLGIKTGRMTDFSASPYPTYQGIISTGTFYDLTLEELAELGVVIFQLFAKVKTWGEKQQPKEAGGAADDGMAKAYDRLKMLMDIGTVYVSDAGNYVFRPPLKGPIDYIVLGRTNYDAAKYLHDHPDFPPANSAAAVEDARQRLERLIAIMDVFYSPSRGAFIYHKAGTDIDLGPTKERALDKLVNEHPDLGREG